MAHSHRNCCLIPPLTVVSQVSLRQFNITHAQGFFRTASCHFSNEWATAPNVFRSYWEKAGGLVYRCTVLPIYIWFQCSGGGGRLCMSADQKQQWAIEIQCYTRGTLLQEWNQERRKEMYCGETWLKNQCPISWITTPDLARQIPYLISQE